MSTKSASVLVLICSTPNDLGPAIGRWLIDTITPRAAELAVDLVPVVPADLNLRQWSSIVDAADGFIAVTSEHDDGMPATLRNALDRLGPEWTWKPIGFVSYGKTSAGTRSVHHARQMVPTLRLVPLVPTVAIRVADGMTDGQPPPDDARDAAGVGLLDELVRLSRALRPMREQARATTVPGPLPGSYARRLTPDDAPEVTVLQRCCWVDEAVTNGTLAIPALHESLEEVRGWLADHHATGVWLDGRLLAMVRGRRVDNDWHVGRLAVVPDLRGHGLGRWLLRTAEAAAGPDIRRFVLFTGAQSRRNITLYESEGYALTPSTGPAGIVHLTKNVSVGTPTVPR
jgi:NAD(P)H-dependent FMN reductase/GNAT superfamily N-acetyltransferase